ncbi:MAG: enoyl-CoA hydratase/isomerase family protein [Proteobacteria bacterium]|nr:enoyl-CoA hydratase/isomerase family protein [Pseudomonadota bacterium]
MDYRHIIYEPGRVARIILNRPRYLNAQSYLMREEMDDAFRRAAEDDAAGCIVLSGAGEHFSVGHDIGTQEDVDYCKERGDVGWALDTRNERFWDQRATFMENTLRWRNLPKPTMAMVKGYCIFGGCMFASAMDVIFAAEDALFLPGTIQFFHAPWDLGARKAKEILFEHRYMPAREAMKFGFVNRVFPREALEEETLAYAGRVADNYLRDPFWYRMTKFNINHMQDAMGFSNEIQAGYNNYMVMTGVIRPELPHPSEGGFARTKIAKNNLEASRPWIESET